MFAGPLSHQLRLFCITSAVGLSLFLTLTAALDTPAVQANRRATITPSAQSLGAETRDVSIAGFAFNPSAITVTTGTTVRWTNADSFAHTVTSDMGSLDPWDSGLLNLNGVFTKTFAAPGSYGYHCTIHPGMRGTVTVLSPRVYVPLVQR